MINTMLILIPFICWNSGFFWPLLFLAVTVIRFRFNRVRILLISGIFGALIAAVLPYCYSYFKPLNVIYIIFGFQVILMTWSILYYLVKQLWKNDLVFLVMEPYLLWLLSGYIINEGFDMQFRQNIYTWLTVYIVFQLALVLIKILVAYNITSRVKSRMQRLRLVRSYLPYIEPNIGLGDFSLSGASLYIVEPTCQSHIIGEFEHLTKIINAEMKQDIDAVKKITLEKERSTQKGKRRSADMKRE